MTEQHDAAPTPSPITPLTSLRFFAALIVILYHSGASYARSTVDFPKLITTALLNGYVGVTFFFVLSGFILQHIYAGKVASNLEVKSFFLARFARIYPVYILALLLMLPVAYQPGWRGVPQFFLLQRWMPNSIYEFSNWNMPSWTLSVELLFYILFPLISNAIIRTRTGAIVAIAVALMAFDFATGAPTIFNNNNLPMGWMLYVPTPILRLPEFLIGVSFGEIYRRRSTMLFWLRASPLAAAILVILATTSGTFTAATTTVLSALLILVLAQRPDDLLAKALSWRPLVILGASSYALYLLQEPVHFAISALAGPHKWMLLAQYPAMILTALAVFQWYEEGMRERIRRWFHIRPSINLKLLWSSAERRRLGS